ncbi:hypothetical protein L1987_23901 [Smallanthus sonchifolius]|uniref:Uncharacterized protein n=1 Tax=Smallanthus sonchifolius TaxID=185202 RepID=A0ACB9IJJ2_9ASTR|nr:hypothetical protein L1987_23901 [Smallanthus sonchifolius]
MKSALSRKGKNKATSSSTARAKKSRQQPEPEQIPKPNWRKTKRLGWEEALSFRDEEGQNKNPRKAIYQWMATMKKELGSNPPCTMTLTGKVGNKNMIMSFDSIRKVVLFGVREDVPPMAKDLMEKEEEEQEDDTEESESESETRRLKISVQERVVANRPAEYAGWDRPFQMLWDQNACHNEEEVNDRHRDAEVRRRDDDCCTTRLQKEVNNRHGDA